MKVWHGRLGGGGGGGGWGIGRGRGLIGTQNGGSPCIPVQSVISFGKAHGGLSFWLRGLKPTSHPLAICPCNCRFWQIVNCGVVNVPKSRCIMGYVQMGHCLLHLLFHPSTLFQTFHFLNLLLMSSWKIALHIAETKWNSKYKHPFPFQELLLF